MCSVLTLLLYKFKNSNYFDDSNPIGFPSLLPDQEAMIVFNKKPFTDVFKIDVLKISQYSQEKPVLESLFNKVAGVQSLNLITKQRYFPVSIAKFLRKTYFTANPRWLLLFFFLGSCQNDLLHAKVYLIHKNKCSLLILSDELFSVF